MKKFLPILICMMMCFSTTSNAASVNIVTEGGQYEASGFDRPKKHKKAYGVRKQPKFRSCKSAKRKVGRR